MKTKIPKFSILLATIGIAAISNKTYAQDHGHLNVGAGSQNQDAMLLFDNGADFATTNAYVYTLTYTNAGKYAGYYQGNITFTALAATAAYGGPSDNAAALGAQIYGHLASVDGPAGGAFGFWEAGATSPTVSLTTGATGTNLYILSQNDGSPGSDPYGHIHGRRFTATKPGIYTVSFRALDLSTNGMNGGPIHMPSDVLKMYFQAGVNIQSVMPETNQTRIRFGAKAGYTWQLQAASSLTAADWTSIGAPLTGSDYFNDLIDESPVEGQRFYRVVGTPD